MVIARALGDQFMFVIFTANPNWAEVLAELEHNQTLDSRPDLIAKVFKLKVNKTLYNLKERHVSGDFTQTALHFEEKLFIYLCLFYKFLHPNPNPKSKNWYC